MSEKEQGTTIKKRFGVRRTHPEYAYKLGLRDYVVKKGYKLVDQETYIGKDAENTFNFKDGHIIVLTASNDVTHQKNKNLRSLTEWNEYDQVDRDKLIRSGNIFDLVAREKGIDNNIANYRKVILPEITKTLGSYDKYQALTSAAKLNEFDQKAHLNEEKTTEEGLKQHERILKKYMIPMEQQLINEIERSGTLFGKEAGVMPLLVRPLDLKEMNGLPYPGHAGKQCEMRGLEYIQAMQDARVMDKRFVYKQDCHNILFRNGSDGAQHKVPGLGTYGIQPINENEPGLDYIYIKHNRGNKNEGEHKDLLTGKKLVPFNRLMEKGCKIPELTQTKNQNLAMKLTKLMAEYSGAFVNPYDQKATNQNMEKAMKNPARELRDAFLMHTSMGHIKHARGLQILQRELAVDWAMRHCGFTGGVEIPEEDRKELLAYLKEDVRGKEKKQWKLGKLVSSKKEPGYYLNIAAINMDRTNEDLQRFSRQMKWHMKDKTNNNPLEKKELFDNISIVMDSYYKDKKGQEYSEGAGAHEKKIQGENAYLLLADMMQKDKAIYNAQNGIYQKQPERMETREVRLKLKVGDHEIPLSFQPGRLDMKNATRVRNAIVAMATRTEYDRAYNQNTIDTEYKKYVNWNKFDNPEYEDTPERKLRFVDQKRSEYQSKKAEMIEMLKDFGNDEAKYLDKNEELRKDLDKTANCYRYMVPTKRNEFILEAFESKNVIAMYQGKASLGSEGMTVVELRKQLDVLEKDGDVVRSDPKGPAYYYDASPAHANATKTLQALPYLTLQEKEQEAAFDRNFTMNLKINQDGKMESYEFHGVGAREALIDMMSSDREIFETAKDEKIRSIDAMIPYNVEMKYGKETLVSREGCLGEMKVCNYKSVEEFLKSDYDKMNDDQKKALENCMKNGLVEKKYSERKTVEEELSRCEIYTPKEIAKVLSQPVKCQEVVENTDKYTKNEALDMEAAVNYKTTDEEKMDYKVRALAEEAKKGRMKDPVRYIKDTIGYDKLTDEGKKLADKSMEQPEVKRMMKGKGIHR